MEKKKDKVLIDIDNSDLADATKKTYTSRINQLWKIDKWYKDPIASIAEMNPADNLNTEVNCTSQILAIQKVSKTFKNMIDEDDMMDMRELYDKLITAAKQIDRSDERDNDVTWKYLLSLKDNVDNTNITGSDRLLYSLYIYPGTDGFVPRLDYADMKIVDDLDDTEDDDTINYYVKNKRMFIFNMYKTHIKYGRQKIKISAALEKHIPKNQEWLFERGGKPLSDNALGKKLSSAMRRLSGGKKISVVTIRRAYASYISDLPDDERRKISLRMGHSSTTNSSYAHNKSDSEEEEQNKRILELK